MRILINIGDNPVAWTAIFLPICKNRTTLYYTFKFNFLARAKIDCFQMYSYVMRQKPKNSYISELVSILGVV